MIITANRSSLRHFSLTLLGLPPVLVAIIGYASIVHSALATAPLPTEAAELFGLTNIWTVHFKLTPDQWADMEPKGGDGPFGFGRRGPFGGPPGDERNRGRQPDFGLATFLAPMFLRDGDSNHDGRLSRDEFETLAGKWFAAWDTNKSGKLDEAKIRKGLNATLGLGNRVGPPGGHGPGNGGPGFFLQGPEGGRNGVAAAAGIEFEYVHADMEFEGTAFGDVAVRYKGNGTFLESRNSLKRSLKVDLSKFVKGQKLAGITKLNLHNNVTDASWMNEVLSHRLYRDAGVPAPQTAYARVFVTVPGKFDHQYFGLYSLVEDVDSSFVRQRFSTKHGAIFKPVTPSLFSYLGDSWSNYKQTYDPKTSLSEEDKQRVLDLCRLTTNADDKEFVARIGAFIDLEEFARFMAVMVFLSDMDGILGPGQNFYLYLHPKTQRFEFIPWDQDHSFGQFPMRGTQEQRENLSVLKPWDGDNSFLERMFKLEGFKRLYLANLKEFNRTIFKPERFFKQVDDLAAIIRPAVAEESSGKVKRFDAAVAGENVSPSFGGPRFGGFGGPLKPIKAFVRPRAQSISEQISGKSEGMTVTGFGGFGRGPRGPRGGPGDGDPTEFGPGMFLGRVWMQAFDQQRKGEIASEDFARSFERFFQNWNTDRTGFLTEEQLHAGIDKDLSPFRGGPPPGFGPAPDFGGQHEPPPGP